MSDVYKAGFDGALTGNGLSDGNQTFERGISSNATAPFQNDISVTAGSNSNPYTSSGAGWQQSGARLSYAPQWGIWTLSGNATLEALGIKVDNLVTNTRVKFIEITGGDLPSSETDGTEVTLGFNSGGGKLDVKRPGIAEALIQGVQNLNLYYVLLDTNGNVEDSKQASNSGGPGPTWEYSSGTPKFNIGSNLEITNTTGTQYDVEEVQVRIGSTTGITFMQDTSISVGVPNNATLTFTALEIVVNGLV